MFQKGDKIFYGQTGVCVVEDISEREIARNVKKLYYTLQPIYRQNNKIYAPVDSDKIFMRAMISKDEAQKLINAAPEIRKAALNDTGEEDYKALLESHSCEKLLCLAVKMYAKKQAARAERKKLGFVDERYFKRAEELLFEELAAALEITPDDVPALLF